MSRPLRLEFPDALYHVTARGNNRQAIHRDDIDRERHLELLAHVVDRFGWLLHAYCLMNNHYHLLIETPLPNLSSAMRQLNGVYAQRFNRRHDRVGHVFQARFAALLVQHERHLLGVARYIVLNPVRAGLVSHPADWPWSSYRATVGLAPVPGFLTVRWLHAQFGGGSSGREAFARFVTDALPEARPTAVGQIYVGDERFAEAHAPCAAVEEVPRPHWQPTRPELAELFAAHGDTAIATAYRHYGYTLREIAAHRGVHYATISRRLKALERNAT